MSKPKKYSVVLNGHATSVTLEEPFWLGLNEIAQTRGVSINTLIADIDDATNGNLSSACRVYAYLNKT